MLSILIPVYNFDVIALVSDLEKQCLSCNIPFEIICMDDASDEAFKVKNKGLKEVEHLVYKELPQNIGRSKIRNQLAAMAKYNQLLFLDCDSKTNNPHFIANYANQIDGESVIYGGRNYEKEQPSNKATYFRWWYGINRETISAKKRNEAIYSHFMTNNFCVPKAVYQRIKLDETIKGYGHEDTLFGIELSQQKVPIIHIENPLCHVGLEDFETFIDKTEQGIANLNKLLTSKKTDNSIKLIKALRLVERLGLSIVAQAYWRKNRACILQKLQKENVNLRWFDLYKLGYLIDLRTQTNP